MMTAATSSALAAPTVVDDAYKRHSPCDGVAECLRWLSLFSWALA